MHRGLLVVLFVCGVSILAGAASGAPAESAFAQEDIDPDDVLLSVTVDENGDATWRIEYRTRLETDADEQAFEDLQSDVEADPGPYAQRFRDRMNGTARSAENATGREMSIADMTVSAERRDLPQAYGVLTYRFTWANFAAVDGDRLRVGDAVAGMFLDEETSLLLSWPDGYELSAAYPTPDETRDGAVVYDGPTDFGADEPRIELGSAAGDGLRSNAPMFVGALVAMALGGAGVYLAYRRREGAVEDADTDGDAAAAAETDDTEPASTANPDPELLSNEEQVLRLIEREGGRMKQQAVADRLGWTDAKTSQVTKALRESGELEGFRLGRENVLALPDDDPRSE